VSECRGTQNHTLLSQFLRLLQLGEPCPLIYIPQEQGGPAIPPGTGNGQVKVILRPTVSRPVRRGVRHPSGTRDQFFFHLGIFFRQLRVCYFVAPSLREDGSVIYCCC
jgi:hypothetical protein